MSNRLVTMMFNVYLVLFLLQGRVFGITIGCLIGMFPLLFMNKEVIGEKEEKH